MVGWSYCGGCLCSLQAVVVLSLDFSAWCGGCVKLSWLGGGCVRLSWLVWWLCEAVVAGVVVV